MFSTLVGGLDMYGKERTLVRMWLYGLHDAEARGDGIVDDVYGISFMLLSLSFQISNERDRRFGIQVREM